MSIRNLMEELSRKNGNGQLNIGEVKRRPTPTFLSMKQQFMLADWLKETDRERARSEIAERATSELGFQVNVTHITRFCNELGIQAGKPKGAPRQTISQRIAMIEARLVELEERVMR